MTADTMATTSDARVDQLTAALNEAAGVLGELASLFEAIITLDEPADVQNLASAGKRLANASCNDAERVATLAAVRTGLVGGIERKQPETQR